MKIKKAFLFLAFLTLAASPLSAQDETTTPARTEVPPLSPEEILREDVKEPEGSNFYKEFFNMLFTLGLLIFVLFAISWFLRRMNLQRVQVANESSAIKILDQRPLSPRSTLFVVQHNGKEYFLGESQQGVTILNATDFVPEVDESLPTKKFTI